MPASSRTKAPVARQRTVVKSRIGSTIFPKENGPSLVSTPHRQNHHPVSDTAVIHIPHSRPVQKNTLGRKPPNLVPCQCERP